ncbi:MAG: nucleotidyl transferase AbiEii/AbiGii toxin family protein [Pseudomonadales bacterium]|nr:nucleotidyl transferase AbiEii/AbiGii toxin family protein [Pseudomonadales bacterium]
MRVLPHLARHDCFALKGGTAINLFVRDLPRLSVDIDLAYLLVNDRAEALTDIRQHFDALEQELLGALPGLRVQGPAPASQSQRLTLTFHGVQIKIELSPVLRGAVWPVEVREVSPKVEEVFGYAAAAVVSLNDLYAGKICAALDRQHPRDLFDVMLLLDNEGISRDLLTAFLVYLISGDRPMTELLAPKRKDIAALYDAEFRAMTVEPVALDALLETRERLIAELHAKLTDADRAFLISVKSREPDWGLLGLAAVADLPAVKWKLLNLDRMAPEKHAAAVANLKSVLSGKRPGG